MESAIFFSLTFKQGSEKLIFNLFRSIHKLEDDELISRYQKKGDIRFVAEFYQRYAQMIAALCLKYLKHKENAQDAAMDVFEIMCRDLKIYEIQKPSNWLYSITKNHCLKLIRQHRKLVIEENPSEVYHRAFMEIYEKDSLNNEEELETELHELKNALENLKIEQSTCVKLFFLDKLSYQEICDKTGYPVNKVKSYIQNGKRKLKIQLEKRLEKEQ